MYSVHDHIARSGRLENTALENADKNALLENSEVVTTESRTAFGMTL